MKPITQPSSANELPNKVIPSPMSLDASKKIPPMEVIKIPVPIKYSGFSFNNFFIISYFTPIYLKSVGNESRGLVVVYS